MNNLPLIALLTFTILAPRAVRAAENKDEEALTKKYQQFISQAKDESPLVKRIFSNSYVCAGKTGFSAVKEAEDKAKQLTAQIHSLLTKDKKGLDSANTSIQSAIDENLKGKLKPNLGSVDICKGEADSIKQLFNDAKKEAKAAANKKIDDIAKDGRANIEKQQGLIKQQIQKNNADRPGDIQKIGMALHFCFSEAETKACTYVRDAVGKGEADKQMQGYIEELEKLQKNWDSWKSSKKAEVAAQVDAQVDKAQNAMLGGRSCDQGKVAEAGNAKTKDSKVSEADKKPATTAKTDQTSVSSQPAKSAEVPKAEAAQKSEAPPVAAAKENAANSVAGDVFKEVPPPDAEKTATADPAKNPPATSAGAETSPELKKDYAELSQAYEEATRPFQAPEETAATAEKPKSVFETGTSANYDDVTKIGTTPKVDSPVGVDTGTVQIQSGTDDRSVASVDSNSIRNTYQNSQFFESRDLDLYSKKDTTYIQQALNQVNGNSDVAVDGAYGKQTAAALDAVMKDPVKKAAFAKALRSITN